MEREPQWIVILNVWVWLAVVSFLITHANPVPDKHDDEHPGFISIDCGSPNEYFDRETGITYKTDSGFVETGYNHMVSSTADLNYRFFGKLLNTLRCFPDGDRNCYTLKPDQGKNNRYLIRAVFSYGNYDSKNDDPSFELHLGVNLGDRVDLTGSDYVVTELIHTPSTDTIDVCLVKTGPTTPCISSLELRPLDSSIYQIMSSSDPQPTLNLWGRIDVGNNGSDTFSRYKDDIYDRMWRYDEHDNYVSYHSVVYESIDIVPRTTDDAYKLPVEVLRTAALPRNASHTLKLFWDLDKPYELCLPPLC